MIDLLPIHETHHADISYRHVGRTDVTRYEKMHVEVFADSGDASVAVAHEIANLIRAKAYQRQKCVLGLATGSSPIRVYDELVRLHREEGLSFANVVTFNLDEYYPMERTSTRSYWYFMHEHLFNHVDIDPQNIHLPDGLVPLQSVYQHCMDYEEEINRHGGLDFQLLGIGRTGHVGFNEPGSNSRSLTRLITLDHLTRVDAAPDFQGLNNVPTRAITMGIDTIRKARRVVLVAWGHKKASIVQEAVEGEKTSVLPASFLQEHDNLTVLLDREACSELRRFKTPWLVGPCQWDEDLTRKAIVWLSSKLEKPILKLTERDYNNNGMSDLLALGNSAYDLNIRMYNKLQHTITGWPGGKPGVDDSQRPERADPARKRVILFSPHPDDDVISMGGTFLRLVDQGHEVHVAYQTSGNIAVSHTDARRFAEFCHEMNLLSGVENAQLDAALEALKHPDQSAEKDPDLVLKIKGLIRRGEAAAGARFCGLPDSQIHFLDMPFYETGKSKKKPLGQADIDLVKELILQVRPHQIYAAGDLADPHGTHKVCLDAIFAALEQLKGDKAIKDTWLWLYRGAWQEWPVHEIEMAVPLSPQEVDKKRQAIFFHQSQKDGVMFQGEDDREFWQRAEQRNRETARRYNQLGLTEYEAIEAFRRWRF
ncbi:glucosamine-6-phosphate deaminase [Neolewinella lacunae]|uniref:Glucosamine-6-phosphate deaminase n=1 Tax=Neolewinella lacunae TaxID=1517758 RepID=A0A923PLE9_9BACT|nr:glucosamine-6-phosphate deaminase [Neolewinella lacunae]MBC6996210.1 glucosamine-6-phosphate deaminase [Neolewinella lacunae]MDN3637167.1 glucosamine-6-phosphate deaminase [Neolewinella lacunae]